MSMAMSSSGLASPVSSARIPAMAWSICGVGVASTAPGWRRRNPCRAASAEASGRCTPTSPLSPQATPAQPIAVSKRAYWVMARL